jgi:hypothetical protein
MCVEGWMAEPQIPKTISSIVVIVTAVDFEEDMIVGKNGRSDI